MIEVDLYYLEAPLLSYFAPCWGSSLRPSSPRRGEAAPYQAQGVEMTKKEKAKQQLQKSPQSMLIKGMRITSVTEDETANPDSILYHCDVYIILG